MVRKCPALILTTKIKSSVHEVMLKKRIYVGKTPFDFFKFNFTFYSFLRPLHSLLLFFCFFFFCLNINPDEILTGTRTAPQCGRMNLCLISINHSLTVRRRLCAHLFIQRSSIHLSRRPICLLSSLPLSSSLLFGPSVCRLGQNIHCHLSISGYRSVTGPTVGKEECELGCG